MLDEKKARYDEIFRKQAGYNFRIDEMLKDMNNLATRERTDNEKAQYQMIITRHRQEMQDEINQAEADTTNYALYNVLFNQLQATQETTPTYFEEKSRLDYLTGQIQKAQDILDKRNIR